MEEIIRQNLSTFEMQQREVKYFLTQSFLKLLPFLTLLYEYFGSFCDDKCFWLIADFISKQTKIMVLCYWDSSTMPQ